MRPFRVDSALRERVRHVAAWALVMLACGCAGRGLPLGDDGRYHHSEPRYSIEPPRFGAEPAWKRVSIDGSDLAWRTEDGRSMSLSSSCRKTKAKPALLARRLLLGVERDEVLGAHPIALRGAPGWAQVVETGGDGRAVRIKTVTVVSAGCVFDWLLVAPAGARFDQSLDVFDAWWASFERGPAPQGEGAAVADEGGGS